MEAGRLTPTPTAGRGADRATIVGALSLLKHLVEFTERHNVGTRFLATPTGYVDSANRAVGMQRFHEAWLHHTSLGDLPAPDISEAPEDETSAAVAEVLEGKRISIGVGLWQAAQVHRAAVQLLEARRQLQPAARQDVSKHADAFTGTNEGPKCCANSTTDANKSTVALSNTRKPYSTTVGR